VIRDAAHVVMCSQNLPVPQDRRVWREATALRAAGHDVTVACPRGRGQLRVEVLEGVAVVRYPAAPQLPGLLGHVVESAWALACLTAIAVWLRARGRLDVLHAANPPDTFFVIAWALRRFGARFVYDQHDLCPELLAARAGRPVPGLDRLLRRLELASYRRADLVIAPNDSYRRVATGRGGCHPDEVVVVRSGPDSCRTRPSAAGRRPLVVVFAGMMNEQDGVELLLKAAATVLARRPGALVLDMVGTGDEVPRLRSLAAAHGIAPHVRWAGWLDGPALDERVAAASLGVSIDRDDEFSRLSTMAKVPDYLGLGLPVVLADLPENRVTAGPAGAYFAPGDAEDLARALEALIDDPGRLADLERAAARRAPLLAWDRSAPRLVGAYRWLLGGGPPVHGEQPVEPSLSSDA
jgi:glycosyltransferase involved in cell wall biosynthesis